MSKQGAPASATLPVHIPLVLVSALLLFPTLAMAEPGQSSASTATSLPSGLVVVIANKPEQERLDLRALNNTFISGVALQIRGERRGRQERSVRPASPSWRNRCSHLAVVLTLRPKASAAFRRLQPSAWALWTNSSRLSGVVFALLCTFIGASPMVSLLRTNSFPPETRVNNVLSLYN